MLRVVVIRGIVVMRRVVEMRGVVMMRVVEMNMDLTVEMMQVGQVQP